MQYAINSYSFLFVVTDMDFSKKKNLLRQHINEGSVSFLMLHVTCICKWLCFVILFSCSTASSLCLASFCVMSTPLIPAVVVSLFLCTVNK